MAENGSPISKLHVELLWTIFLMNTDGETDLAWLPTTELETQDRPLTITRRSSQVCKNWRDIILGSPSLWGKVVDISLLSRLARGHWMNEVVRRSGQHFLHITTDNIGVSERLGPLVTLLDDHWERIRVLNVTIRVKTGEDTIVDEVSQILRRPTKSLQSFRVKLESDIGANPDLEAIPPLFGNAAPALTAVYCAHSYLDLDSPSPWFCQLHTLHISLETWVHPVPKILEALKGTPVLETLTLAGETFRQGAIRFPEKSVTLPNLKSTRLLNEHIQAIATILDALIVPADCGLIIVTNHHGLATDLSNMYQALHRYSQSYFSARTTTSIRLSITPHLVRFHDTSPTCEAPTFGISLFSLNVVSDRRFSDDALSLILSSFTDAKFDNISHITLDICPSNIHPDANFIQFLSRLPSLEVIETAEPMTTLHFLLENTKDLNPIVFPRLETLLLTTMPNQSISSGPLLPFLKWRKDAGVPIEVIDLEDLDPESSPQDMDILEEMTGLRVTWFAMLIKTPEGYRQYLCGSGNPEMLRGIGSKNEK